MKTTAIGACAAGFKALPTAALVLASALQPARAATATREIFIDAPPAKVWDALRDVGAVDRRLAPGLVLSDHLEDGVRTLTFASGRVTRERIVSVDENLHRIAYTPLGGSAAYQTSSMQVFPSGGGSRLVWMVDILPDDLADRAADTVGQILPTIKSTLERRP